MSQHLIAREDFAAQALYTSASPGANFSSVSTGQFRQRFVGPRLATTASP